MTTSEKDPSKVNFPFAPGMKTERSSLGSDALRATPCVDDYERLLVQVADSDLAGLRKARQSYGDSWRKRGGVGAFMMLARKWDRLENRVQLTRDDSPHAAPIQPYDIFRHAMADRRAEGLIDDIRDLRRYLLLVEAHLLEHGEFGVSRDNKETAS